MGRELTIEIRAFDRGMPPGASVGYGEDIWPIGDGTLITGYLEGKQATRLVRLDPASGPIAVLKGASGLLRGLITSSDRSIVYALTTYGIDVIDLESFRRIGKIRKGVPAHADRWIPFPGGDLAAVTMRFGPTTTVVSLSQQAVVKRLKLRADTILERQGGFRLFDLEYGIVADVNTDLSTRKRRRFEPRMASALAFDHYIAALPGPLVAGSKPGPMTSGTDPRYEIVDPDGTIALLDPESLAIVRASTPIPDLCTLVGHTDSGFLIGYSARPGFSVGRKVVFIDDATLAVVADARLPDRCHQVVLDRASRLVALPRAADAPAQLIEWTDRR